MELRTRYRDRELFLLALQVLSRFAEGVEPTPENLHRLAASLPADMRSLPTDELATVVIRMQM